MRNRWVAGTVVSAATVLSGTAWAEGGIRTDRLSEKGLARWNKIVAIVMAEDAGGRPLHPTLRALWDAVDASGPAVFVELPEPKCRRPYIVGGSRSRAWIPKGGLSRAFW